MPYLALLTTSALLLAAVSSCWSPYQPAEAVKMRNRTAGRSNSGLCALLSPAALTNASLCACCLPSPADDSSQVNWRGLWETANQLDTGNRNGSRHQGGSQLSLVDLPARELCCHQSSQACTVGQVKMLCISDPMH